MPDLSIFDANLKDVTRPLRGAGITTRKMLCATCDIACSVTGEVRDGRVVRIRASDNPAFKENICMKGVIAPKGFEHPNRLHYPLKRVGERGSGKWERVSWEDAMSGIGARLSKIVDAHGPEAWAVSTKSMEYSYRSRFGAPFDEPCRFAQLDQRRCALRGKHRCHKSHDLRLVSEPRLSEHQLYRAFRPQSKTPQLGSGL